MTTTNKCDVMVDKMLFVGFLYLAYILLKHIPSKSNSLSAIFYSHEMMHNFIKCLFYIYWNDHMIFIFLSVDVGYQIIYLHLLHSRVPCASFISTLNEVRLKFQHAEKPGGSMHLPQTAASEREFVLWCIFIWYWALTEGRRAGVTNVNWLLFLLTSIWLFLALCWSGFL
jgi:hypothetical protein